MNSALIHGELLLKPTVAASSTTLGCTVRWRAVLIDLLRIQTPRNAVELDIGPFDLASAINGQEIETPHSVLARSDLWEQPMPHDLVARVDDVERLNVWVWVLQNLALPLCT